MIASYRLQLDPEFGFQEVEQLIPYFRKLGVSHLYFSPITESRPRSTHGYDVVDHNAVREELGGQEGFASLLGAVEEAGLKLILDFVPNHAGVGPRNQYWQDVLAFGPHSPYARYFDIDWNPLKPELQGKILLPSLGKTYGEIFDDGEIHIQYEDGRFFAAYYDNRHALSPASYSLIIEAALPLYERTDHYWDVRDLLEAYKGLAPHEREKAEALSRRIIILSQRLNIEDWLGALDKERLHELLEVQFWRLSYWKTAGYEINYRRFFDINGLVGLHMEDEHVFWDAHRLLGELLAQEAVAGVRIDHIDGLFDPHEYLDRLKDLGANQIWVEKILAPGETLPEGWPVEGTSGYEFLNDTMGVLVQPEGQLPLERTYRRFVPEAISYDNEVNRSKHVVITTTLSSELFRLAYELDRISEADYHTRDFTLEALREALSEVVAAFERYRTYLPYDQDEARKVVRLAVHKAQLRNPAFEPTVYQFITRVILGGLRDDLTDIQQSWVGRFQQYTAPVAAKGVEDTAFYRYLLLVALNEVGGEPSRFGQSIQAYHSHARYRSLRYPRNLLATATHDHKRGEDTRMRQIVLAELPGQWDETVNALSDIGDAYRSDRGPSRADEYLFYQILVALWNDSDHDELPERLWNYMQKASRESKVNTSWINPDAAYEEALEVFVRSMLRDNRVGPTIQELCDRLSEFGFFNTLSQVVLKLASPGVPDIYQGCELMDFSLVDPDNRRPVDFAARSSLLDELHDLIETPAIEPVRTMVASREARAKLYFIARLLRVRSSFPDLFEGDYLELTVSDEDANYWITFARKTEQRVLIVLVPRFPVSLPEHRNSTVLLPDEMAPYTWTDSLTGYRIHSRDSMLKLEELPLPWAVLISDEPPLADDATKDSEE